MRSIYIYDISSLRVKELKLKQSVTYSYKMVRKLLLPRPYRMKFEFGMPVIFSKQRNII